MTTHLAVAGGGPGIRPVGSGQTPSSHGGPMAGLRRVGADEDDDWPLEVPVVDPKHCQALHEDGTQCGAYPMKKHDSIYCVGHHRSRTAQDFIDAALADVDAQASEG